MPRVSLTLLNFELRPSGAGLMVLLLCLALVTGCHSMHRQSLMPFAGPEPQRVEGAAYAT